MALNCDQHIEGAYIGMFFSDAYIQNNLALGYVKLKQR
jgi:hypothetical protein